MTERRVVAILGAGGSLGAAISARLADEPDTDVVLSDVSGASLQSTLDGLHAGASVETVLADVGDPDQVDAVVARAVERFGLEEIGTGVHAAPLLAATSLIEARIRV